MLEIGIVLFCLAVNALFACFEMAFVTVGKPALRNLVRQGNRAAARLLLLRQNPERTLSVVQVGITLVGIISAAASGAGAEESFAPFFERRYGFSEETSEAIAISLVVLPLTLLNVIVGELIPKAIALRSPVRVATFGVNWVALVDKLFSPLVWVLEKITKGFLRLLPGNRATANVDHVASIDIDHLSSQTQQYVLNLVGIEGRKAKDLMVEWSDVEFVKSGATRDEVVAMAIKSGHTRLPVLDQGDVVGLLHTKEFIATLVTGIEDWTPLIRPIIELQPSTPALTALKLMQDRKSYLAVVKSSGRPSGILTFEDVIEEVVGELYDEDDDGRIQKLLSNPPHRRRRL